MEVCIIRNIEVEKWTSIFNQKTRKDYKIQTVLMETVSQKVVYG